MQDMALVESAEPKQEGGYLKAKINEFETKSKEKLKTSTEAKMNLRSIINLDFTW